MELLWICIVHVQILSTKLTYIIGTACVRTAIIYEYSETGVVGLNRGRRIRLGRGESVDKRECKGESNRERFNADSYKQ